MVKEEERERRKGYEMGDRKRIKGGCPKGKKRAAKSYKKKGCKLREERGKEGSERERGKAGQTRQWKGSQRVEKIKLGLPKVTGN